MKTNIWLLEEGFCGSEFGQVSFRGKIPFYVFPPKLPFFDDERGRLGIDKDKLLPISRGDEKKVGLRSTAF
jgi:hypothetical protein